METDINFCGTLFLQSVQAHQQLVDILLQARNADGISVLTELEMAVRMNRSLTWVKKAIEQLNREEVCIKRVSPNGYTIQYDNILERGVFADIMSLIRECDSSPELLQVPDSALATEKNLNIKTVQMGKAYIRAR